MFVLFCTKAEERLNNNQYDGLIDAKVNPRNLKRLASTAPCSIAIQTPRPKGTAAFHWELEFPEVFFGEAGYRSDSGFDAIVGNPPYDVLSEKETGHDLSQFKEFIDRMPIYACHPKLAKNNLYKLFICRIAVPVCKRRWTAGIYHADGDPRGMNSASAIRAAIFQQGTFTFIEAFPQKDDPSSSI